MQDESDRNGMRIVVELKKGAEPDVVVNQLYQYTPLQITFSIINIAWSTASRARSSLSEMMVASSWTTARKSSAGARVPASQGPPARPHPRRPDPRGRRHRRASSRSSRSPPTSPTATQRLMAHGLRLAENATVAQAAARRRSSASATSDRPVPHAASRPTPSWPCSSSGSPAWKSNKLAEEYTKLVEEIEGYEAILPTRACVLDIIREDIYRDEGKVRRRPPHRDRRRRRATSTSRTSSPRRTSSSRITHEGYIKRMPLDDLPQAGPRRRRASSAPTPRKATSSRTSSSPPRTTTVFFTNIGRMLLAEGLRHPGDAAASQGPGHRQPAGNAGRREDHAPCVAVRDFDEAVPGHRHRAGPVKKTPLAAYGNPRKGGIMPSASKRATAHRRGQTTGNDQIILGTAQRPGHPLRGRPTSAPWAAPPPASRASTCAKATRSSTWSSLDADGHAADRLRKRLRQAHRLRANTASRPRRQGRHQHQDHRAQRQGRGHEVRPRRRRTDAHHRNGMVSAPAWANSAKSAGPPRAYE